MRVFKKVHRCAFALLNNQEVGERIDRPGHGAGALKPPHAERNCIGFRETAFQKGSKKKEEKEMKDKKKRLNTGEEMEIKEAGCRQSRANHGRRD